MSTDRPDGIDRFTAERLLRGEPAGPDGLAELLAAAAPPPAAGELAGEDAAVAAFREAHLGPAPQLRRRSMVKTALAKLLTLKVAAAALTATAAGGVALAAGTGNLPGTPSDTPAPKRPAATHSTGRTGSHHKPASSPSPSLVGLCHAFQAGAGDNPGKALESPAFRHLITTAGGKDKVAAYCTNLLKPSHGKSGSHRPATPRSHRPTAHPTGRPSDHPGH
jgi:hypothetical protein